MVVLAEGEYWLLVEEPEWVSLQVPAEPPVDKLDTSVASGTMTADMWHGRCDCTEASSLLHHQ